MSTGDAMCTIEQPDLARHCNHYRRTPASVGVIRLTSTIPKASSERVTQPEGIVHQVNPVRL
jgi:hypothetical protein